MTANAAHGETVSIRQPALQPRVSVGTVTSIVQGRYGVRVDEVAPRGNVVYFSNQR